MGELLVLMDYDAGVSALGGGSGVVTWASPVVAGNDSVPAWSVA
jgi:hypothetical protein